MRKQTRRNEVTHSRSPTSEATEPEFEVGLSESSTEVLFSEMSIFEMGILKVRLLASSRCGPKKLLGGWIA